MKTLTEIALDGKRSEYTITDEAFEQLTQKDGTARRNVDQVTIRLWRTLVYSASVASMTKKGTKDNMRHTARAALCSEILASAYGPTTDFWNLQAFVATGEAFDQADGG